MSLIDKFHNKKIKFYKKNIKIDKNIYEKVIMIRLINSISKSNYILIFSD